MLNNNEKRLRMQLYGLPSCHPAPNHRQNAKRGLFPSNGFREAGRLKSPSCGHSVADSSPPTHVFFLILLQFIQYALYAHYRRPYSHTYQREIVRMSSTGIPPEGLLKCSRGLKYNQQRRQLYSPRPTTSIGGNRVRPQCQTRPWPYSSRPRPRTLVAHSRVRPGIQGESCKRVTGCVFHPSTLSSISQTRCHSIGVPRSKYREQKKYLSRHFSGTNHAHLGDSSCIINPPTSDYRSYVPGRNTRSNGINRRGKI